MDERPPVEIEGGLAETAGEPGHAGDAHEEPYAALRAAAPGDEAAADQEPADEEIGHDQPELAVVERRPLDAEPENDRDRPERVPEAAHES